MSKKGDKRRRRQQQKRRSPSLEAVRVLEIGGKTLTLDGANMVMESVADHPDAERLEAARRQALESMMEAAASARREIAALLAPFAAFDALFAVWLASRPHSGASSPSLTMAPEMAASVLLDRESPEPIASPLQETQNPLGPVPRKVIALVGDIVAALPLAFMAHVTDEKFQPSAWDEARMRFYQHRLIVRGGAYQEQELETLQQLFSRYDADLQRLAGYSVGELVALYEATGRVATKRYTAFLQQARSHQDQVAAAAATARKRRSSTTDPLALHLASMPPNKARILLLKMMAAWITTHVGSAVAFEANELAAEAGVTIGAAERFLVAFSCGFDRPQTPSLHVETEHIRETPILRSPEGRYLPFAMDSLAYSLRDHLTDVMKREQPLWDSYRAHRAGLLEQRAITALTTTLSADWAYRDVHYYWRDDEGAAREGEADAVIRADSVLILVEAKSHALHRSVRRIAPSMEEKLEEIFTEASDQLDQAESILVRGTPDRVTDSKGHRLDLDLEGITRVLQVAVTLEDLAALAPAAWRLREVGLLDETREPPWFVGVHDLELICELAESPAQLIHYMLRRRRSNRQQIWAMDEMDFFMRYLQHGLFWRDAEARGARVELMSHTGPLDAWWLGEHGQGPSSKRPRQRMNAATRSLLEQIDSTQMQARIEAQLIVLDLSEKARERVSAGLREMARMTKRDDKGHSMTVPVRDDLAVIIHANPPGTALDEATALLRDHVERRQRLSNLRRCLGLTTVVSRDGKHPLSAICLLYDSTRVAEEEADDLTEANDSLEGAGHV